MRYERVVNAKFIDRPNRFIAHVRIPGQQEIETVHVKNTGRCKELLLPDSDVVLFDSQNPARKTRYDLIGVYKNGLGYVNMDSQAPNMAVKEWLGTGDNPAFPGITYLKPECKYGESRIDFYFEQGEKKSFVEVKGVTLEREGVGFFPDAPSQRAVKHIHELMRAVKEGYDAFICYVIQMPGIDTVLPNQETDPEYAKAILEAKKAGVRTLYLNCEMTPDEILITKWRIE